MKFAKLAILATAMAVTPVVANAQDVGTIIYGSDGAELGTVTANDGTTVTVDTGKHLAPLPAGAVGNVEGKWSIAVTASQVNAMMDQQVAAQQAAQAEAEAAAAQEAAAKLEAALIVGAPVVTNDAMALGTVSELLETDVVVANETAGLITLPRSFFTVGTEGELIALNSLEAILAAVQGG